MANRIAGLDHVIVGVADLDAARETWRRLGFVVTPRGRHIGWGTANYCIMFPDDYVELLGIVDPAQFVAGLDEQLKRRGEGLLRLALRTDDAVQAQAALSSAGLGPPPVQELQRELELATGTVLPAFRLVHLPPATLAGLPLFLTQHLTPDLLRKPAWLEHPNGARGIAAMTGVVDDPPALRAAADRLFGDGAATLTDNTLTVLTGDSALLFVRPDDVEVMHPEVAPASLTTPTLLALRFRVSDSGQVGMALGANKVPFAAGMDGVLRVAPDHANGVVVEFGD